MTLHTIQWFLSTICVVLALAPAVGAEAPPPDAEPETTSPGSRGFWPTDTMIEQGIKGRVQHAARRFDLDEQQQADLEALLMERWPIFLREHREELEPLLNEFIAARMSPKAPSPERVADWARRASPVWELIEQQIREGNTEIETLLNDGQREQFAQQMHKMDKGFQRVRSQLGAWREGRFDPSHWGGKRDDPAESRPADDEREQPASGEASSQDAPAGEAAAEAPSEIDLELEAWARYVADFCDSHDLDPSQRSACQSILRELQRRVDAYRASRRAELAELERLIVDPGDTDAERVRQRIEELYGPIDAMFRELKQRIERVPTEAQRKRAQAEQESAPS
jgi:hypothetical protein